LDSETTKPEIIYQVFLDDMVRLLEAKQGVINICIETFLLLSYLANQNDIFKRKLEKDENFIKVLQKIISIYSVIYNITDRPMTICPN
jgi:hypothetical protein